MADPANGLEAMRGLHADTAGWLADPALWLALALGIAAALAIGYVAQRGILRQWALRRAALHELGLARALAAPEALRAQALLLRRVARTVAGDETRQLTGEAWLGKLDSIFVTQFFTCGAGRCFGDALYAPGPADSAAQHGELARLIARLRWRE